MRVNFFSQSGNQNNGPAQGLSATITGPLILAGNPAGPLEAAPKQYVDSAINSLNASNIKTGTLSAARLPAFTGDVASATGSGNFVLNNTGVAAGTYTKITVDGKGRVLAGSNINNDDIPPFDWSKITTGKPTTVDGYGITDALKVDGSTVTGTLNLNLDPTEGMHAVNKQYVDSLSGNGANVIIGSVVRRPVSVTPTGFLRANGGQVSKVTYAALYAKLKAAYLVYGTIDYTSYGSLGSGQPWRQLYDINFKQANDISGWTNTNQYLPQLRKDGQVVITKNRIHYIGGLDINGNPVNTVYTSAINADGTLAGWTTGLSLPSEAYSGRVFTTKNRVYHVAGGNVNGAISSVYTAVINEDGTLSAWSSAGNLPMALAYSQLITTKNRVYVMGGSSGSYQSSIYTALINADGTIGAWSLAGNLPTVLLQSQAIVTKNRVYLLGGYHGGATANVYTAPINADGTLGAWTAATPLPVAVSQGQAIVTNNRVYLYPTSNTTMYTAPINADGTLGAWTSGSSISTPYGNATIAATNNYVYLIGNLTNSAVFSAPFAGGVSDYSPYYNGTINKFDGTDVPTEYLISDSYKEGMILGAGMPWKNQHGIRSSTSVNINAWANTTALPGALAASQAIVTKNRVYLLGGWNAAVGSNSAVVYTAPIDAAGVVGAWTTGTSLPAAFASSTAIVVKKRVYLFGGFVGGTTGNTSGTTNAVYTALINEDGTLGAWTTANALFEQVHGAKAVLINDRVYLLGGATVNTVISNVVWYAPVNPDGTLGAWVKDVNTLPGNIRYSDAFVTNSRVYLVGSTDPVGEVYTAPINTDGTLGAWSKAISLPGAMAAPQIMVTNNRVWVMAASDTAGTYRTVYTAPINSDGTVGTWATQSSTLLTGMYHSQIFLTSSRVYLCGGMGTAGSAIASVQYAGFDAGALNDYMEYHSGVLNGVVTDYFRLPNFSDAESANDYYFVKT